jgi:hypothetical protein
MFSRRVDCVFTLLRFSFVTYVCISFIHDESRAPMRTRSI